MEKSILKGKRKFSLLTILSIIVIVIVPIIFVILIILEFAYKPTISTLFINYFWLGLFISLIAEAMLLGAFGKIVMPWLSWRWQKFIFKRFVIVKISAFTKYNLKKQYSIKDYLKIIKETSKKSFDNINHEQEETPADYWNQLSLGNQTHEVSLRACCIDDEPSQYSKIEINISNEIQFKTFYDSIINIQSILNKFHLCLQQSFDTTVELENIVFEISPIGHVLIENYWFKRVSKDQVIKVETKDGYEILLYEDKAQLCFEEYTSSIREYIENLIISSFEKTLS